MNKVYDYVKENILAQIEQGKETGFLPWKKSWIGFSRPRNYISNKHYNGINLLLLPKQGEYLTFKQIKELQKKDENIKLKKGSKSNMVVFWDFPSNKKDNDTIDVTKELLGNFSDDKRAPIVRYYNVFHINNVEGLKSHAEEFNHENNTKRSIEKFLASIKSDIKFELIKGSNMACFKPLSNIVEVPSINQFECIDNYYLTLFHELIHATGHKSRLNRLKSTDMDTNEYSKEELVAEIGATMIGSSFGIEIKPSSISYINGWSNKIKDERGEFIVTAAQQAEKAVKYLLNIQEMKEAV